MKTIFLSLIILLAAADGFSAVKTWDGGGADGNLQTSLNWIGDTQPLMNDDLVFPASAPQQTINNNYFAFTQFNSFTFEGGSYTIGGNPFFLGSGGINVTTGTQTFNTAVSLRAPQTAVVGTGGTLTVAVLSVGTFPLTINGDGLFGIGLISGSGALTKNGSGATLAAAASGFSGAITLNNGIFVADANIPNSPITINGGEIGGAFGFSGFGGTGTVGATTVNNGAISAGTLTAPTGILNINNGLNFTANGIYACKISGTSPGAGGHDRLNVTGTVAINNARLVPLPFGGFRPAIGDSFTILQNDGADAVNGTFLNAPENGVLAGALNTAFRITYRGGDGNDIVITRVNRAAFDFDGDGRSDLAVFRPSNGIWYLNQSIGGFRGVQFGAVGDRIVPADYDGDNRTDIAVFRPANGTFYQLRSFDNIFAGVLFGASSDIPVPNDYDGDGRADVAVFRPSNGTFYQLRSITNQSFAQAFGQNGDRPLIGDYDGDGIGDLAVYRAGNWFLFESATGAFRAVPFGFSTDKPVPADYDNDGKTDIAVFRPANGTWYLQNSGNNDAVSAIQFGTAEDVPVTADYDGDGKSDVAVFRPSSGIWYLNRSSAGFTGVQFGQNGDQPVPNAYTP